MTRTCICDALSIDSYQAWNKATTDQGVTCLPFDMNKNIFTKIKTSSTRSS